VIARARACVRVYTREGDCDADIDHPCPELRHDRGMKTWMLFVLMFAGCGGSVEGVDVAGGAECGASRCGGAPGHCDELVVCGVPKSCSELCLAQGSSGGQCDDITDNWHACFCTGPDLVLTY